MPEGIKKSTLRLLILEALKKGENQFQFVKEFVEQEAKNRSIFPTSSECQKRNLDYKYYAAGQVNPYDEMNIQEILYDLFIERVITAGSDSSNWQWRFRLTEYGTSVVKDTAPHFNDPAGYLNYLRSSLNSLDSVVEQYIGEGLECFQRRLYFAAAVIFGAAAERSILQLLESIGKAQSNAAKEKKIQQLLDRPKLPDIFNTIDKTVTDLIGNKILPYTVHQGSTEHLLSLFEMIRAHRNDSVHPKTVSVDKFKLQLTINAFPAALQCAERLTEWFSTNTI